MALSAFGIRTIGMIGIICSLINKTSGKVKVYGVDLDDSPAAARMHIGLVPQEFNFNIFEPVGEILINQAGYYGIPRKLARARAETYLRKLELWDRRHDMARELSGGMKCTSPGCSFSTNRPPASTSRSGMRCGISCANSTPAAPPSS